MSSQPRARVLDVGQCNPDHSTIRAVITGSFEADVDRVMFVRDALNAMRERRYDLVLVNRLIFDDGSDGMELIREARQDRQLEGVPILLVSNYPEAQAAAVAAGARPGFGKADLCQSATIGRLAEFLPRKAR